MIPIQMNTLKPFTSRRSNSHKHHTQRPRRTFPRGHFEKLESRMVLSTTWAITPATLPADVVGVAYDQVINTTDTNSVTLAVSNLKKAIPGITVPSSGTNSLLINGTPTAAGTETFTVTATDSVTGKTATAKYSLVVNPVLSLTPATLPGDTVNVAYSQSIASSGGIGPASFGVNITQAIAGLTVATGTGGVSISGTPISTGTETFTVTATDSETPQVTVSTNYSITVNPPVSLSPTTLPADPVYLLPYSQAITAVGGTNPTLTISNIQNPIPGITVPASGTGSITISGTPTAPGTETFTVTAIDSAGGPSASINYSVTANAVNPSGIVLTSVTGNEDQGAASFIDPSGNIVVAGCSTSAPTSPPSTPFKMGVVRYLPNGSLDTSFNGTGFTTTAAPNSGAYFAFCTADYPASPSDKIVVGGMYSNSVWEFALVRYNANGSLDTTFGTNGQVQTKIGNGGESQVHGVLALPNGDILAAGSTIDNNIQDFALACYTPAGVLDTTFKPGAGDPVAFTAPKGIVTTAFGGNSRVYSVAIQTVGTQTYILASGVTVDQRHSGRRAGPLQPQRQSGYNVRHQRSGDGAIRCFPAFGDRRPVGRRFRGRRIER